MKFFLYLFGMAGAGALGYLAEPGLRLQLTGMAPGKTAIAATANGIQALPNGATMINLANLTPEQLPQRVLLKADVKVTDTASGIAMILQKGNRVKLQLAVGKGKAEYDKREDIKKRESDREMKQAQMRATKGR